MVLLASRVVDTQEHEHIMKDREGQVLERPSYVGTFNHDLEQDKEGIDRPGINNPFRVFVNFWVLILLMLSP